MMCTRLLEPDHTKYGGYRHVKKTFETQYGRIPITQVVLAAIGHHFLAKKIRKCRREADEHRDQKPESFCFLGHLKT